MFQNFLIFLDIPFFFLEKKLFQRNWEIISKGPSFQMDLGAGPLSDHYLVPCLEYPSSEPTVRIYWLRNAGAYLAQRARYHARNIGHRSGSFVSLHKSLYNKIAGKSRSSMKMGARVIRSTAEMISNSNHCKIPSFSESLQQIKFCRIIDYCSS